MARNGQISAIQRDGRWYIPKEEARCYDKRYLNSRIDAYISTVVHGKNGAYAVLVLNGAGKELMKFTKPFYGRVSLGSIKAAEDTLEAVAQRQPSALVIHTDYARLKEMSEEISSSPMQEKFREKIKQAAYPVKIVFDSKAVAIERARRMATAGAKGNSLFTAPEISPHCTKVCRDGLLAFRKCSSKDNTHVLSALRTGGKDAYSDMAYDDLMTACTPTVQNYFKTKKDARETIEKAIRWHLRGLSALDAYRKVKLDLAGNNRARAERKDGD